jgi:enolase-phosphatase E1
MPDQVRAVLLDIEGTTTPVDFVYQTLFPFARRHLREFLLSGNSAAGVLEDIALLEQEHAAESRSEDSLPEWTDDALESAVEYALWLMDRDRKSTALKSIQGKIWKLGYQSGELLGVVYEDVPGAFRRWRDQGKVIAIYSSGSVLAQKLIFGHTNAGDLTQFIGYYFDTTTGAKKESASYAKIASALGFRADEVIFFSDSVAELNAAREEGLLTALMARDDKAGESDGHRVTGNFLTE